MFEYYWGHMFGWGLWGALFMLVFWGAIIWFVVWVVKELGSKNGSRGKSALDVLKERYAKFEEKKKDLS